MRGPKTTKNDEKEKQRKNRRPSPHTKHTQIIEVVTKSNCRSFFFSLYLHDHFSYPLLFSFFLFACWLVARDANLIIRAPAGLSRLAPPSLPLQLGQWSRRRPIAPQPLQWMTLLSLPSLGSLAPSSPGVVVVVVVVVADATFTFCLDLSLASSAVRSLQSGQRSRRVPSRPHALQLYFRDPFLSPADLQ
jgi:hypothetical protein